MKKFYTTGPCIPSKHYMVNINERAQQIKQLVDEGYYFIINHARQYGKTTTLGVLRKELAREYTVLFFSFQGIDFDVYQNGATFSQGFSRLILDQHEFNHLEIDQDTIRSLEKLAESDIDKVKMDDLFRILKRWMMKAEKPIVLMIDEVDTATNNQVFLDFLAMLRDGYINRDLFGNPAFQSVILVGVTDITSLRSQIRAEEQHKVNSPWNIAADFGIDLRLSEEGITGMLNEYEADHHTGMNASSVAHVIRDYTNGYPYLVSRICQIIEMNHTQKRFPTLQEAWSEYGVHEAVKELLTENNTLFDSIMGKLINYPQLSQQLERMLLCGEIIEYLPDNLEQRQLRMFGFIENDHNTVVVANKIFEMRLYKYLIGQSQFAEQLRPDALFHKPEFIKDNRLDIPLIMERFIEKHEQIWGMPDNEEDEQRTEHFLEKEGTKRFLTYLSPIINGVGTYEIEPQTRDGRKMDVVIHYMGKRYIIELKIWRGERYHKEGEKQIIGYLDFWNIDTGYMLSFNFNKKKERGIKEIQIGEKVLIEGVV